MIDNRIIIIRTYTYHSEAIIEKAKLESAGIYCSLKDENMVMINPFYSNAVGGIKLIVREEDAETALKILEDQSLDDQISDNEITESEEKEIGENSELPGRKGCLSTFIFIAVVFSYFIFR